MLIPMGTGKVEECSMTVSFFTAPPRRRFMASELSIAAPRYGFSTSDSFPLKGFHIAACGPARLRLDREPEMCSDRIRFTVSVFLSFTAADKLDASGLEENIEEDPFRLLMSGSRVKQQSTLNTAFGHAYGG